MELDDYKPWEIVEIILPKSKKHKSVPKGDYKISKIAIHHTVSGKGCIGNLIKRK